MTIRKIMPNDIIKHLPTGEEWVVCGVNHETGKLVPCGYPFPTMANIADCELIEEQYTTHRQTAEQRNALIKAGLESFVDAKSAMFDGFI